MSALTLCNIHKKYDKTTIIENLSLEIASGEFIVLVGPSGCGKSTLLRIIAGLETPDGGTLKMGGQDVTHLAAGRRSLSMVFQSYALYPHMTVRENLAFGLKNMKTAAEEIDKRIAQAATMLKLDEMLDRLPQNLSGGQRQRVAIGRSIVQQPELFLFDEPLSNLDASLRVEMRQELQELHHQLRNTMIYVTHDQVEAMTLADRIVVLYKGKIEQVGTPLELYNRPANLFVAAFIGTPKINVLPAKWQQNGVLLSSNHFIPLKARPAGLSDGDSLFIAVRPEHLRPGNEGEIKLNVTTKLCELQGDSTLVWCKLGEQNLCLKSFRQLSYPPRSEMTVSMDEACLHFFDGLGKRIPA